MWYVWLVVPVGEAAGQLGITARRVRQLISEGRLRAVKVGRDWLLTEREVDRFAVLDRPRGRPGRGRNP